LVEFDPKTMTLILSGILAVLAAYVPLDMLIVWLRVRSRVQGSRSAEEVGVPVWIVGSFERLAAFALGLYAAPGAAVMLAAWLAGKLAASWQRYPTSDKDMEKNRQVRAGHLVALIVGITSVSVGYLVGLFVRHALEWDALPTAVSPT
jgi:hypothetical protein